MRIEAQPTDTAVFVNGKQARLDTETTAPLPYYGTYAITAVPPEPTAAAPTHEPRLRLQAVEPPVSHWLFPFDFVVELGLAAFDQTEDLVTLTATAAERSTTIVDGVTPAELPLLRARAAEMATER